MVGNIISFKKNARPCFESPPVTRLIDEGFVKALYPYFYRDCSYSLSKLIFNFGSTLVS